MEKELQQKKHVQKKQPSSVVVLIRHFFSGTLWGIMGGVIIISACYISIIRNESLSIQIINITGNQSLSSYEIGKNVTTYISRFPEIVIPYPQRILQSSKNIERYLKSKYPEIAEVDVNYRNFNEIYIDIKEQEAKIVHCNTIPLEEISCWQRSRNGRPLLKTPQNDFDINPKVNTSLILTNNILPAFISEEILTIYQMFSNNNHRIKECTYDPKKPEYVCLMMTHSFGVIQVFVDSASLTKIAVANKPIIDVVLKNIPKEISILNYIDLRFYPKIVYK